MQDHYEVLQVHPKADREAIQAAYNRLRERYNPEALSGAADELVELARRRRDAIELAYTILSDAERRATYDAGLADRRVVEAAMAPLEAAVDDGDAALDYRPLPPANRQERPKGFNSQPTLPRSRAARSGRAAPSSGRLPYWAPLALIVAAATFGVVLAILVSTVMNPPQTTATGEGPNLLGVPTPAATPSTEEIVNRFEGQIVAARQVTEQVPENPNAWIELGHALYDSTVVVRERLGSGDTALQSVYVERLPRWLEASEAYRTALELQPNNPVIRADLAASLCYYGADANDQGYVAQGIDEARQALAEAPEDARVLLGMGLCLVSADPPQTQEALVQWQKLVVLPDVDPNIAFQARQLIDQYSR
ncbi:MAG: DnaJ domain-containing protein [Oscillochloris sp.]|nr:DnaJ domain-containing protein [Oscillochloris sp.]